MPRLLIPRGVKSQSDYIQYVSRKCIETEETGHLGGKFISFAKRVVTIIPLSSIWRMASCPFGRFPLWFRVLSPDKTRRSIVSSLTEPLQWLLAARKPFLVMWGFHAPAGLSYLISEAPSWSNWLVDTWLIIWVIFQTRTNARKTFAG